MMGTVLKDKKTGRTVWGQVGNRLINALAVPIDTMILIVNRDSLVASQPLGKFTVIPGLVEKEIYDRMHRMAIQAGGYEPGKNAFSLSYDWRRDLVEAAKQLGELIEKIKRQQNKPDLKVDLVCHSAGGLIARYYIKYGAIDVLDKNPIPKPTYAGAKNVNKVIMVGSPNAGSVEAFQRLHEGLSIPMVGFLKAETVFTMPSIYQSLPFDGQSMFVDTQGKEVKVNIYDPASWEKYNWSVFSFKRRRALYRKFRRSYKKGPAEMLYAEHISKQRRFLKAVLRRANSFHQALWQGDIEEENKQVNYMLLGSNCQRTLARALLEQIDGEWATSFKTRDDALKGILYDFGDGSVTKDSLLAKDYKQKRHLSVSSEFFVCEKHGDLASSPSYIDNMLNMLLECN
jgi:pimeloyl-ACP methyl ester carboxylesterase